MRRSRRSAGSRPPRRRPRPPASGRRARPRRPRHRGRPPTRSIAATISWSAAASQSSTFMLTCAWPGARQVEAERAHARGASAVTLAHPAAAIHRAEDGVRARSRTTVDRDERGPGPDGESPAVRSSGYTGPEVRRDSAHERVAAGRGGGAASDLAPFRVRRPRRRRGTPGRRPRCPAHRARGNPTQHSTTTAPGRFAQRHEGHDVEHPRVGDARRRGERRSRRSRKTTRSRPAPAPPPRRPRLPGPARVNTDRL